ncbi:hypothetical protein GA0061101_110133 [Rhizobium lusitanum]|uniref:Uncharacterized protein n=1 Tax=Rhizobium lusitanum TaxID=293958 RepID=A0A1C3WEI3_9HYPH|nr:hypothetical protein GA0061101_110133 [Rhizobium lusitanum]
MPFLSPCGSATSWYTRRQINQAREYTLNKVESGVNKAIRADVAESRVAKGEFLPLYNL